MRPSLTLLLGPLAAALLAGCGSSGPLLSLSVSGSATGTGSSATSTTSTRTSSPSSGLPVSRDPCQLLTAADVENVMGEPFTKPVQPLTNVCAYTDTGSRTTAVAVSDAQLPGGAATAPRAVRAAVTEAGGPIHDVSGLGDAAAVSTGGQKTILAFVKNGTLAVVVITGPSVDNPESKAEALGRAIADKL